MKIFIISYLDSKLLERTELLKVIKSNVVFSNVLIILIKIISKTME